MWIKHTNEDVAAFYDADLMDEKLHLSSNNTAQVSDDLGRRLVEHIDDIEPYTNE